MTITDRARNLARTLLDPMGALLVRIGIHPDLVTAVGLVVVAIACVAIARGAFLIGGLILLAGLPLDALDGAVARAMHRTDQFGAVLDSTLDRYADGLIFIALSYYFAESGELTWMLLAMLALLGSLLVSYIRARAEGIGLSVKEGWFTRFERIIVILLMLLVPSLLQIGVVILALGTNITAGQRLWYVYTALNSKGD